MTPYLTLGAQREADQQGDEDPEKEVGVAV
jgi:hypothetical protein